MAMMLVVFVFSCRDDKRPRGPRPATPMQPPASQVTGTPFEAVVVIQNELVQRFSVEDLRDLNPQTLSAWLMGWAIKIRERWERACQEATDYYLAAPEHRILLYAAARDQWTEGKKVMNRAVERWDEEVEARFGEVIRAHDELLVKDESKRKPLDPSIPFYWSVAQLMILEETLIHFTCPFTLQTVHPQDGPSSPDTP